MWSIVTEYLVVIPKGSTAKLVESEHIDGVIVCDMGKLRELTAPLQTTVLPQPQFDSAIYGLPIREMVHQTWDEATAPTVLSRFLTES